MGVSPVAPEKTAEDEGRRRGRLGYDAKHIPGTGASLHRYPGTSCLYPFSVVSSAPIEHSAYFDLAGLQKSEYEDELGYEYDVRNDREERALSDGMEISLGSNLSTSRRLAIVLVVVLRLRLRIEVVC